MTETATKTDIERIEKQIAAMQELLIKRLGDILDVCIGNLEHLKQAQVERRQAEAAGPGQTWDRSKWPDA